MGEEVIVYVDDDLSCRICHDDEIIEDCKTLEAPCACSGTLKYAHRECIQRWCDEKGDTICELCLQEYEPGYTALPRKCNTIIVGEVVTIREGLEDTREEEIQEQRVTLLDSEYSDCSSATDRGLSYCRTLAFLITVLLLGKHLLIVLSTGAAHCPFSLVTVMMLRASGIVLPMYVIVQTITAIQRRIRRQHHNPLECNGNDEEEQLL